MLLRGTANTLRRAIEAVAVSDKGLSEEERIHYAAWKRQYVYKVGRSAALLGSIVLFFSLIPIYFLTPEPMRSIQLTTHGSVVLIMATWKLQEKIRWFDIRVGFVVIELLFAAGYSRMIDASFAQVPVDFISVAFGSILFIAIAIFCLTLYPYFNASIILMALVFYGLGLQAWGPDPYGKTSDWAAISGGCMVFAVVMFYARVYRQRAEALSEVAARTLLIQKERRRVESVEQELVVASEIQDSFAPSSSTFNGAGLNVFFYQAKHAVLGGDWSAIRTLPSGELAILVADATGKGVQAALVIQALQALWAIELAKPSFDPLEWIQSVNRTLITLGRRKDHTMTLGLVLVSAGQLTYYSAGHVPVFVACKEDDTAAPGVRVVHARGNLLGMEEDLRLTPVRVDLEEIHAESILLGTDGVFDKGGRTPKRDVTELLDGLSKDGVKALDACEAVDDKLLVWIRRAA